MKLLHVISSINPENGGPIEGVKQLGTVLTDMGHCIEICSIDPPGTPWQEDIPLTTYALGPPRFSYSYSPSLIPWLRENVARYDAVIVNGIWQFHSVAVHLALKSSKIPYFVFTHGMLDPWFKQKYPLKHLKKSLYWPIGEYPTLRDAKAVLFTCEEERQLANRAFLPYSFQEAVVNYGTAAPSGDASRQKEAFLEQFPELRGQRFFLYLSRIHEKKGCDLLIQAFAHIAMRDPSLHLVVAGPDQTGWRAELEKIAMKLGISSRILWPGMLRGDQKWGAFHAAEAFILPSHQENFGIVVAEAMSCGKPVLISNKVNIWREIEADGAGIISNDDLQGTIELMERWLAKSPEEQQEMQKNALRCFANRFEIHQAAQSLCDVIAHTVRS